jgi:TatA/E family protein of Tat protein translocase
MGGLSVWHWLIFLAVALLLFGGSGKISSIMGDVAKGIKSFKKGMAEDDDGRGPEEGRAAQGHRGHGSQARADGHGRDQEGRLAPTRTHPGNLLPGSMVPLAPALAIAGYRGQAPV